MTKKNIPKNPEDAVSMLEQDKVKFVNLVFTDLYGTIKTVGITSDEFRQAAEDGKWFDGSSIKGFARIEETDQFLKPDLSSYTVIPFGEKDKRTAWFFCDVHTPDGELFDGSPRQTLKNVASKAEDKGLEFIVAPELEFFLYRELDNVEAPIPLDNAGYFDLEPYDPKGTGEVRKDILLALRNMSIDANMSHHEVSASQHEIGWKYGPVLEAADNLIRVKWAVRSVAHKHGLKATFMPKPIPGQNGSGMHVHFSFNKDGKNVFYEKDRPYELSDLAQQSIAGILANVKGMTPVLNPTVNSYKRLLPGYEAPVHICWAANSRAALVRIPRTMGKSESTRAEIRSPDPMCNPYLGFASLLGACLDGIENNRELPEEAKGNVDRMSDEERRSAGIDRLPYTLVDALRDYQRSDLMRSVFGEHLHAQFYKAMIAEWDAFNERVHPWERSMYLDR